MTSKFSSKDILGLRFLEKEDIELILNQAKSFKEVISRPNKQVPILRGKTILNFFCEPSTRTKSSFDMAIKLLGAGSMNFNAKSSSFSKGETLFDTVKNIQALGIDGVIIRHQHGGAPHFIAKNLNVPVLNAGDGYNEHPSQALLDIYTMRESCKTLKNKNVLILGDIAHSRVARSNIWGLKKLGANIFVSGPETLIPPDIEKMGVKVVYNIDNIMPKLDFINVLRVQYERQGIGYFPSIREYRHFFGLTQDRLKTAKSNIVIMHPGPINRGIEIDTDVADGPHNVILDQVTNGVAVRMALLYLLITGGTN
jgi:aspartate carbamoyltransferase catalytic subunit